MKVTITINLSRPINGSKKSPTCTVPAEHSNARQQADEILNKENKEETFVSNDSLKRSYAGQLTTNKIRTIPVGVLRCKESQ